MVIKTAYTNSSDYLIAPELAFALSAQISATGITAGSDGRKVIKAGTPLYIAAGKNVYQDRTEKLTTAAKAGESNNSLVGIARHDIDVTNGDANDAVLTRGYVEWYRLDSAVQTALTSAIQSSLSPEIIFVKGAK